MKSIDYENMFIYMSLVFAFCIFIILLYGCAFASGASGSQIYENFLNEDDKGDIKSQVVSLLTELENSNKTRVDDRKKIGDAKEKINNNNISISELKTVIDLLKRMMPRTVSKKPSVDAAATTAPSNITAGTSSATTPSNATAPSNITAGTSSATTPSNATAPSNITAGTSSVTDRTSTP